MAKRYDLLIFDWDGTLYDSIPFIVDCLQSAARDHELAVPTNSEARSVIGLSLRLAMRQLFPNQPTASIDDLIDSYSRYYRMRPVKAQDFFDGVNEMLSRLKQAGYQLAVATGKQNRFIPDLLQATGTHNCFDAYRGADETLSKPDPRMLHEIMGRVRANPDRTLMVGDSIHDLQMALGAGVEAVAVTCGANTLEELLPFSPIHCLSETRELLPLLV